MERDGRVAGIEDGGFAICGCDHVLGELLGAAGAQRDSSKPIVKILDSKVQEGNIAY